MRTGTIITITITITIKIIIIIYLNLVLAIPKCFDIYRIHECVSL